MRIGLEAKSDLRQELFKARRFLPGRRKHITSGRRSTIAPRNSPSDCRGSIDLSDPRVSISELFGEDTGSDDEQSVAEMHRAALKEKLMLADMQQLVEIANRAGVTCAEHSLEMVCGLII